MTGYMVKWGHFYIYEITRKYKISFRYDPVGKARLFMWTNFGDNLMMYKQTRKFY